MEIHMEYAYLVWLLFLFSCTNAKVDDVRDLKLQVYVNPIVPHGKRTAVVITMSKMPDYQVQLRLGTRSYLLTYCIIGTGAPKFPLIFSKCESIQSKLTQLGMVPYILADYESGYLAKINAVFWNLNDTALKLEAKVFNQPDIHRVKVTYKFAIKKPEMCVPQIKIQYCDSHESPMEAAVVRSFSANVIFLASCNAKETYLKWSLYDLEERVAMRTFSSHRQRLVVQRSQLNYYTKYELWRNQYLLFVKGEWNGIEYAARCYIKIAKEEVKAVIVGGSARTVMPNKPLLMDGSQSRDYSKLPKQKQFKFYYWNCQSNEDHKNDHCINNISTGDALKTMRFTIPANVYKTGSIYTFTLRVVSDYNPKVSSLARQMVTMQKQDQLSVTIECIKNCAERVYNPNKQVQLEAKCHNCGQQGTVLYKWHVYGKYVMSSKIFTIRWNSDQEGLQVELLAEATDGRVGSDELLLEKHMPPIGGTCTVEPTSGIEATTLFRFCCQDFITNTHPLNYYFYSNLLLLTNCASCDCETFLPLDAQRIKVLICGGMLTCTELQLHVNVEAMKIGTLQMARLINTEPIPIILTQKTNEDRFLMIAQSMASRIRNTHDALALLYTFEKVFPRSVLSLGKVANMMLTIAHRLSPINYAEHEVLTRSLTILNGIFKNIYEDDMQRMLLHQPFHNISIACVTIFDMMQMLNEAPIHTPQSIYKQYVEAVKSKSLTQNIIDKLIYEAKSIPHELGREISLLWLDSMWQTERLYRYLGVVRQLEVQPRRTKVNRVTYDFDIHCLEIEQDRQYQFNSIHNMYTVYFSPKLLQSMKDPKSKTICLKIISIYRFLNWWYPMDKKPSEVLLSVHIYTHKDDFKTEIYLSDSDITFEIHMDEYGPVDRSAPYMKRIAVPQPLKMNKIVRQEERDLVFPSDDENLLEERTADRKNITISNVLLEPRSMNLWNNENEDEYGDYDDDVGDLHDTIPHQVHAEIKIMQNVQLYRVKIMARSMIAVNFQDVTHDLHIYLTVGKPPDDLREALAKSRCFVLASSKNKTMLIRNNCETFGNVYMAIQIKGAEKHYNKPDLVPSGPARFSFVFQLRNCDHWIYEKKEWAEHNCVPALKNYGMMCTCNVLGTYTGYVYNIQSTRVPLLQKVETHINWLLVTIEIIVIILTIIWLIILFIWFNKRPGTTVFCDMSIREADLHRDPHDILIYLKTGGRQNSQTTATVRLVFQTVQHTELQVDVMQNPSEPLLKRNSTYVLWLRTRNIRIPTRIAVSHNNAGRYPSWFLLSIEVVDNNMGLTQVFIVNRWIRTKMLILSSAMVLRRGTAGTVGTWCERFRTEFEHQWINWGMWRPVTGEWRESKDQIGMTRFERCCIFVCKIYASVTVVIVYKGHTTMVDEDEGNVFAIGMLWMFVYSVIATIIIHIIFLNLPHDRTTPNDLITKKRKSIDRP